MIKRLYHFSENHDITVFEPRPVRVPSRRALGMEWLNGPLVWAIDDEHAPLYLFPRDCPRIVMWRTAGTTRVDADRFLDRDARMTAYVEHAWLPQIVAAHLSRYEFPADRFIDIGDAGMHVARERIACCARTDITDLLRLLAAEHVTLRVVDSLAPLENAWRTTVRVSGIRLRNATTWQEHSRAGRS